MAVSLSIGIFVYQRYITQSQPASMVSSLRASGHRVTLLDPLSSFCETGKLTWLGKIDMIIARGRFFGLLQKLGWVEMQEESIPFNDRRISVASIYDETEQTARTGDRYNPSACSRHANVISCQVHDSCYSVIVNPAFRGDGNGLCVVRHPDQMMVLPRPEAGVHFKRYLPDNGCDLELYGMKDRIWVVRKPASLSTTVSTIYA